MKVSPLIVAALFAGACLPIAAATPDAGAVALPKGASQQEALTAFSRASGKMVVAERTRVDRQSEHPIERLDTEEGLSRLTAEFHLHAMVGADRVLFVRRFWDTKEPLDLPIEEVTSVISSLHELIIPLTSHVQLKDVESLNDGFYKSLLPAQIAAAQNRALHLADLTPEQSRVWGQIQAEIQFDGPAMALRTEDEIFSNWGNLRLKWFPADDLPQGRIEWLRLDWMAPGEPERDLHLYGGYYYRGEPAAPAGLRAESSSATLPAPPKPVTRCPARCGVLPEPITLAELTARIGATNGVKIDVPSWAGDREFYVFAEGHTGDEVLQSLAEINGWQIRPAGAARFVLERPRVSPATGYADYFQKARGLLPPTVRLLIPVSLVGNILSKDFRAGRSPLGIRQARGAHERWAIADHTLRLDPQQNGLPVSAFDQGWQRRIANRILESHFVENCSELADRPLRPWFTKPDQCNFWIKGNPDFNKSPWLYFEYQPQPGESALQNPAFGYMVNLNHGM